MDSVLVTLALVLFIGAGGMLVRGAAALSVRLGVPAAFISASAIGFGTSAPELLISIPAAIEGAPGIALGNVIGSNIFDVTGIVGVPALARPLAVPDEILGRDH